MNNRQAGRRRGRGGQRPQNNSGRGGDGNRIDNRARGNAAQLLEKYKNLARDSQMQGDRVNTEYYLQFADHYFRVLSDSRTRSEETNRRQRADSDDDDDDFDQDSDNRDTRGDERDNRSDRETRGDRDNRNDRNDRDNRNDREDRGNRSDGNRAEGNRAEGNRPEQGDRDTRAGRSDEQRAEAPRNARRNNNSGNGSAGHANGAAQHEESDARPQSAAGNDANADDKPRRRGRPKKEVAQDAAPEGIDADRLPPALSVEAGEEDAKPRRRRTVRPKPDDSDGATNAA